MEQNVSEELFNALIKANLARVNTNYLERGVWMDWDLNNGILKGNFSIPIKKTIDVESGGCLIQTEDFLIPDTE